MSLKFRKVRVGFANLILSFLEGQDKAAEISKDIISYLEDTHNVEIINFESAIGNRKEARAAWKVFKAADVDAVILFNGTFNTGELTAEIVRNMDCAFAVWGIGELAVQKQTFTGSVVGVMPAGTIFKNFDRAFSTVYGTIDNDQTRKQVNNFIAAVRGIAYLREANIGLIGTRPDGFQISGFDELSIKKLFNTELINISLYTLSKKVKEITEKEIDEDMKIQNEIFSISPDLQDPARKLSGVYLALKKFVDEYELQSYAPDCWPEFRDNDLAPFCPANGRMNAEGIMASCEADVDGSLSLMLLYSIGQSTPWFADFVNYIDDSDALLFWHCGNAPYNLSSSKPVIEPIFGGPSQVHSLKEGAVTVCRLNSIRGEYTLHAGAGMAIDSKPTLKGSNMLVRMNCGNTAFVESMLNNGIPHHNALIYGDITEELREFGKIMNIPVIIHK